MTDDLLWLMLLGIGLIMLFWPGKKKPEGDYFHDYRPLRNIVPPPEPKREPKFVYIHPDCGQPGFYLTEKPKVGDLILSSKAVLLDGTYPRHGMSVVCGTCGAQIPFSPRTSDVRELVV